MASHPANPGAQSASRRPIVRSGKLVHHRSFRYESEVSERPGPTPPVEHAASSLNRRRFRFARAAVIVAASSAAMVSAQPPLLRDEPMRLDIASEIAEPESPAGAVSPGVLLAPNPIFDPAWLAKIDGVKINPYEVAPKSQPKLIRKVPRARRVAWRHAGEIEAPSKVSDLKANPYE